MAIARGLCKHRGMRFSSPLLVLLLAATGACGSTSSTFVEPPPPDNGFGDGGDKTISNGKPDGGITPNQTGCSEAAKLVYVVSDLNELFSFAPDQVKFTKIGELKCPSTSTP